MRYAGWIVVAATTGIVVAASCIPDFQFRERQETDGGGGGSGGGGGGSAGGPTVPCTTDAAAPPCGQGDVCCYHTTNPACDLCSPSSSPCAAAPECADEGSYAKLYCDSPDDCGPGEHCCMTYDTQLDNNGDPEFIIQGIVCQPSCTDTQVAVCDDQADCDAMPCSYINYPGYKICGSLSP